MLSLKEQYVNAESYFNEHKEIVPETLKLKLYGLSKQAKEGDCRMPMPPSSNAILRAKWEAWTAYLGTPTEKAMQEFIALVSKIEQRSRRSLNVANTSNSSSISSTLNFSKQSSASTKQAAAQASAKPAFSEAPGFVRKQGTLYKQRDVFKGWRPRHFVLIDHFLQYYIEVDDAVPRNTLDLTGCTASTTKPTTVDNIDYYQLVITHQKFSKAYNLSALTQADADDWVTKINQAAASSSAVESVSASPSKATGGPSQAAGTDNIPVTLQRLLVDESVSSSSTGESTDIVNVEETMRGIPTKELAVRIEKCANALIDATCAESEGWQHMFEKNGVIGTRRPGDKVCVRGETVMPYNVYDVFAIIANIDNQLKLDPQRKKQEKIKPMSQHTWLDYILFKEVWPTSPRDFVTMIHWRLLKDDTTVLVSFSHKDDDIKKEIDGNVRGEIILGGYVLRRLPGSEGTRVSYVAQTDLKGSLPSSVVNMVSSGQPMILHAVRKMLDQKAAAGEVKAIDAPVIYEELTAVVDKDQEQSAAPTKNDDSSTSSIKTPAASAGKSEVQAASSSTFVSSTSSASEIDSNSGSSANTSTSASSSGATSGSTSKRMPRPKTWREQKINAVALCALFLPTLLYFVVDSSFRGIAFLVGLAVAYNYIVRLHMGCPAARSTGGGGSSSSASRNHSPIITTPGQSVPPSRVVIRMPIDLGRLLQYLDAKRASSKLDVTITHITVKACAMVLADMPSLNGHVRFGEFYRSRNPDVDLSVSCDVTEKDTLAIKIEDANLKPIEYLSDELLKRFTTLRAAAAPPAKGAPAPTPAKATLRQKILGALPTSLSAYFDGMLHQLAVHYGVSIPVLDVVAFPLGVCSVITSPNVEGEADVDIAVVPDAANCSTPIVVSIGAVKVNPSLDTDRTKLIGTPVLSFAVSIDSRAASMTECRRFCSRLRRFLAEPALLDKLDKRAAFIREEESKRKAIFG